MSRTKAEQACIDRDGPICLRCRRDLHDFPASVHHRLPRSAGTKAQVDRVENLVVLCGTGTTPGACHPWAHANPREAYATGWLIRRGSPDAPHQIPLYDLQGRQFFLTEEAEVIETCPAGFYPADPAEHVAVF